jgi:hypothetical protein
MGMQDMRLRTSKDFRKTTLRVSSVFFICSPFQFVINANWRNQTYFPDRDLCKADAGFVVFPCGVAAKWASNMLRKVFTLPLLYYLSALRCAPSHYDFA